MMLAIQFAVSLVAILAVAGLVGWMGLGGDVRLRGEDEARQLASDALGGFDPVDIVVDRAGIGALARDASGRVLLLRRHGSHFAARLLDDCAHARLDRNFLTIGTGEARFGRVTLDLGDRAGSWAASLRRIGGSGHG